MDTSDVDISFDERGYCNHCNDYFDRIAKRTYQGAESDRKLARMVARIKASGQGKKYDCLMGVSGGIDSSYAAYIAKKAGLRVLLLHIDNGWNSDVSERNIVSIADKLGFDYQRYEPDREEFRDLQLSFLRASVPEIETPTDIAIPAALHKTASKYGLKFILSGGNFATEGILPKTWHYNARDVAYLNHIHREFGNGKLKTFPLFGWKQEAWYKLARGIRYVYLLNYVPYSKTTAMPLLEKELGWQYYGGKHYESKYTGFVQSYILPVKFNIDYRRATFSTQICAGVMTREEALNELKKKPYDHEKIRVEKEYVCRKLQISVKEFDSIIEQPAKYYRDYPNAEKKLEVLYKIYRKFFQNPD